MFDLSNALAIERIVGTPYLQRREIEILAINVDARVGNHSAYMVG